MENNYILYVDMDASKGKADAAILKVCDRRSVKPKFLRKKLSFKFVKSEVTSFLILLEVILMIIVPVSVLL